MKNTSETVKCEHTPTPWLVRNRTGRYHITPTDNEFLTCAATSGFNNQEAQANAQFIVTACNAHDVLLDACKSMLDLLNNSDVRFMICDGGKGNLGEHALYHRTINQARKAISLATTT